MDDNDDNNAQCAFCGEIGPYRDICQHIASEHPEAESPPETGTDRGEWSDEESRLLLDKYHLYLNMVGPMKNYKRKKDMRVQISEDIKFILNANKSALQCENRFKTIMKRKKKAIDTNKSTGASRMDIPYEEELRNIAAVEDSLEPEIRMDQNKVETVVKEPILAKKKKIEKQKSMQQVLLEINQKNLEEKERRHQERLEVLKDFCNRFFGKKESNEENE